MITADLATIADLDSLPVTIQYVAEVPSKCGTPSPRSVDQWTVKISSAAGTDPIEYFTGIGLRRKPRAPWATKPKPVAPSIAHVMHSLVMESTAADENFHDWCSNCGFSDDSINAFNTYRKCLERATVLRKHISPSTLRQLRELLQDY